MTPLDRARGSPTPTAGTGRSSRPARSACCGSRVVAALWLARRRIRASAPASLRYIRSDPPDPPVADPLALADRATARPGRSPSAKFGTDPIWWLYLFWIPDFLHRRYGIDLQSMALPLVVIYLIADVGSIGGGWLSSALLKRGWTANRARKTAMLTCALAVTPIAFAANVRSRVDGGRCWSGSRQPRTRAGRPTSTRWRRTCSRARRSDRSIGFAGMAGADWRHADRQSHRLRPAGDRAATCRSSSSRHRPTSSRCWSSTCSCRASSRHASRRRR